MTEPLTDKKARQKGKKKSNLEDLTQAGAPVLLPEEAEARPFMSSLTTNQFSQLFFDTFLQPMEAPIFQNKLKQILAYENEHNFKTDGNNSKGAPCSNRRRS